MEIKQYVLRIKSKILLQPTDLVFHKGEINHIIGRNEVGKSQLAKDFVLNHSGHMRPEITENTTLISNASCIPRDITKDFLVQLLKSYFICTVKIDYLGDLLGIETIPDHIPIRKLNKGQQEKLKLLSFLSKDKPIIILDEITKDLDETTVHDLYTFFNSYISDNPEKVIINITHSAKDLTYLPGKYFLFKDLTIEEYDSKEAVVDEYICF